ncbi:MAG: hypothetical protein Q9227_005263 [Pyrenula ochraceoflavens]
MASAIPKTMKAVFVEKTGGPEVLQYREDYPVPEPKENEVLVKNNFSGINYIDTYFRTGLYPSPKPEVLGREAAGTIASVGSSTSSSAPSFSPGDRVVWMHNSSYAEYSAVPTEKVLKIPDGVTDEQAAGGLLMGMTALSIIRESYAVKKGDTVLLHAAAGGVGLLLCQLLRKVGAYVIGTAGGPEKGALAKENGADVVIDYRAEKDWLGKVKELTKGEGVDVVFDSVGKDTWEGSLEAVKRKGSMIFFGNASGPVPPFPVAYVLPQPFRQSSENIKLMRMSVMAYVVTRAEFEHYGNEFFKALKEGLNIKIHKVYPLKDTAQCHIVRPRGKKDDG